MPGPSTPIIESDYQVWCGNVPREMTADQLKRFFIEKKWPEPSEAVLQRGSGVRHSQRQFAILTFERTADPKFLLEMDRPGCWPDGLHVFFRSVPSLVSGVGHVFLGPRYHPIAVLCPACILKGYHVCGNFFP